jgi:hypothetical protein
MDAFAASVLRGGVLLHFWLHLYGCIWAHLTGFIVFSTLQKFSFHSNLQDVEFCRKCSTRRRSCTWAVRTQTALSPFAKQEDGIQNRAARYVLSIVNSLVFRSSAGQNRPCHSLALSY